MHLISHLLMFDCINHCSKNSILILWNIVNTSRPTANALDSWCLRSNSIFHISFNNTKYASIDARFTSCWLYSQLLNHIDSILVVHLSTLGSFQHLTLLSACCLSTYKTFHCSIDRLTCFCAFLDYFLSLI